MTNVYGKKKHLLHDLTSAFAPYTHVNIYLHVMNTQNGCYIDFVGTYRFTRKKRKPM